MPGDHLDGMKRYFRAIAYKAGMNDSEESWHEVDNTGGNIAQLAEEATAGGHRAQPLSVLQQ
jgi:hypothetical protein